MAVIEGELTSDVMARRWAIAHRERRALVAMARRRGLSLQDAEDCVQEAMLRVVPLPDLDESRMAALLTTVVVRAGVDMHRRSVSASRAVERISARACAFPAPDPAAVVADRDEASWSARLVERLPALQRRVLLARAEGRAVNEIAAELSVSSKAVESLLSRARAALKSSMAAGLSAAFGLLRNLRSISPLVAASAGASAFLVAAALQLPGFGPPNGSRGLDDLGASGRGDSSSADSGGRLAAAGLGGGGTPADDASRRLGSRRSTAIADGGNVGDAARVTHYELVAPAGPVEPSVRWTSPPDDRPLSERVRSCVENGYDLGVQHDDGTVDPSSENGGCRNEPSLLIVRP